MFYRQRTYELMNNGVGSSEEVHVGCMVIQQSCVRSSQSRDVEYVGSERWSHPDACLTRCFAALLSLPFVPCSLTNRQTDLSNALLIYGLNRP